MKTRNLKKMSKSEKRIFLTADLINRMIRVEQRVSKRFNHPLNYNETKCYESLNAEQRKNFENFRKNKILLKLFVFIIPILALGFFIIVQYGITLNVVEATFTYGLQNYGLWIGIVLVVLVVLCALIFLIKTFRKNNKNNPEIKIQTKKQRKLFKARGHR